ncbi:unnamed protein product [Paramecium octaurelia]|uniref:OTU domain-containing protein n=1 Tax=Paramecium octaurelia TaxID=43137 RepID=A0A8S1YEY6_PAROT|nr:unnamed protein product [Paramecium octaurelia]
MSEDLTEKQKEQTPYDYYVIALLLLVFLIYKIYNYCFKCQPSNNQPKENEGSKREKYQKIQQEEEQELSSQSHQGRAQMDQNESIKSKIVKQLEDLKKKVQNQHKPSYNVLKNQTPSQNFKQSIIQIKQIINKTSKERELAEEYKYYIRRYKDKSELKKNYGLTLKASFELYKYCNAFREVRGDGNCFYTAFGFQFLSILLFDYSLDQFNEFFNRIKQIELPMKIFVAGTDLKIDDKEQEKQLLDEFQRRMIKLKSIEDINQREEQFHNEFAAYEQQSDEIDGCLYGLSTLFFRNYSNYIIDFSDAKGAVNDREKLLNWEEECNSNEVVIAELAKRLNILVQLIFIENKENIVVREYGNNKEHKIILLIKPGHYNIGYYQEATIIDQYIQSLTQLNGITWENEESDKNQQNIAQQIEQLYNQIIILIKNNTLKEKDAFKILGFQILPLK